jgi:hypothetical protein
VFAALKKRAAFRLILGKRVVTFGQSIFCTHFPYSPYSFAFGSDGGCSCDASNAIENDCHSRN